MSERVKLIVELKEQMAQLATSLKVYSPDWELVGKAKYEGYMTSVTDTYIQRTFRDNGHVKGWLAVHITELGSGIASNYYVRIGSSMSKFKHERNWSFKTKDLPEKIQAFGAEMEKVMIAQIEEEREERRKDAETRNKVEGLFSDIPGWKLANGNSYSLNSEIKGPGYSYDIHTYHYEDKGTFQHSIDLGNMSPEEIKLVVRTLVDHKKNSKKVANAR